MHGLGVVGVAAEAAIEVQEVHAFGQFAPAFAPQVLADVVFDRVQNTIRVFAGSGKCKRFLHA